MYAVGAMKPVSKPDETIVPRYGTTSSNNTPHVECVGLLQLIIIRSPHFRLERKPRVHARSAYFTLLYNAYTLVKEISRLDVLYI